ncbi:MAG: sensor histidine kinase [Elainellaceae cyanobacterium]
MVMPVSSEFIELCEAQVEILSDALGAALCIVYLADEPTPSRNSDRQSTQLVPFIVRPEGASEWTDVEQAAWLENQAHWYKPKQVSLPASAQLDVVQSDSDQHLRFTEPLAEVEPICDAGQKAQRQSKPEPELEPELEPEPAEQQVEFLPSFASDSSELPDTATEASTPSAIAPLAKNADSAEHLQIAVPLVYQGVMVGLLITARPDRFWTPREQSQIEQIAKTLTMAYVVDQRARWLKARLAKQQTDQQELYAQQQDIFDDLLHQFRNPLTALRTFGKLLLRRLQADDRNQNIAESIVRESDRLQDMLKQFKSALDEPLPLLPSASDEADVQEAEAQEPDAQKPISAYPQPQHIQSETTLQRDAHDAAAAPSNQGKNAEPLAIAPSLSQAVDDAEEGAYLLLDGCSDPINPSCEQPVLDSELSARDVPLKRTSSSQYLTGHRICREPCDWSAVLDPVLAIAEAIAQEQDIELTVDLPSDLPQVLADPLGLREALSNLIDNALKYTPSGGHVRVQGGIESAGLWAIAIIDSGPGIPESDLDHLFERHYRGVQAQGNISGTGLGLAIAQDLLHQMDGEIEVFSPVCEAEFLPQWSESQATRPGTAFVVWLEQAHATADEQP